MADVDDPSTWHKFAEPDKEYQQTIKAIGGAPDLFGAKDAAVIRATMAKRKPMKTPPPAGVKEEDRQILVRDGTTIPIRIHSPQTPPAAGSALAVVIHGGGWVIGDLESQEQLCRVLVSELGMTVVNVGYRLAPENQFPVPVYDCYDATKWASSWAAANATSIGADPTKGFTIGGSSAGGNMSSVVSHLWNDAGETPKMTGVHLISALLCDPGFLPKQHAANYRSWDDLQNADILNHSATEFCLGSYIPNHADRGNPLHSPMIWKSGHKGLPPHLFQVSGWDPVRDDALIYDRILREEAGVPTKMHVYTGQPHGFASVFPKTKASERFYEDAVDGYRWILSQGQ